MADAVATDLPEFVALDTSGSSNSNVKAKKMRKRANDYSFILQFKCKCPPASEVRKLHALIKNVYIPRRPASINYCILHFSSQEHCSTVRKTLHGKCMHRFLGNLQCRDTTKNILQKLSGLSTEELKETHFNCLDLQQMKRTSSSEENLPDVKCNSTARELLVRYGMVCVNMETWKRKSRNISETKNRQRKRLRKIKGTSKKKATG